MLYARRGVSAPNDTSADEDSMMQQRDEEQQSNLPQESDDIQAEMTWQRMIVRQTAVWRPPTDVYELDSKLVILVEIAGMRDSDFQLVLHGRHLMISGVRRLAAARQDATCLQMEVKHGQFRTDVYLPWEVQRDQVTATYQDGMLHVELLQAPRSQIRIITLDDDHVEQA